ncbi:MAG: segregation/condensation protein A [Phycisphaerae bacterium]|nr:segregation/condensation protein A [Phycisphaerae bacterium]
MTDYKVALDVYNGPLDLLLFLVRREEVDIYEIPIARVTEQFLAYVSLLEEIDPEAAGDFLVLAATLVEIKSRTLLPKPPPEEDGEEMIDPRHELVRQLLAYKTFKDAARDLGDRAFERSLRHERQPAEPVSAPDEIELDNLEVWDLFAAFNRLLEQTGKRSAVHHVRIDETPIALHADDILDSLQRAGGSQPFSDIFQGRSRPEMIGLFLALLELIRRRRVRATQERHASPILLVLLDATPVEEPLEETPAEENESPTLPADLKEPESGAAPASAEDRETADQSEFEYPDTAGEDTELGGDVDVRLLDQAERNVNEFLMGSPDTTHSDTAESPSPPRAKSDAAE